jgi:short-subunit dehydrogenase
MEPALREKLGQWALIVGGSEGVGACFARRLAGLGFNLVITGYFGDGVAATAGNLRDEFGVEVREVTHDLVQGDPLVPVTPVTDDIDVGLLIYTAGSVAPVPFLDDTLDHALKSMRLNCHGQTAFCHHYGRLMRKRGGGGMIIVGSNAGEFGIAGLASYAAAKAYTKVLAESLWLELKPDHIDVLGLILGATRTPFIERLGAPIDDPAFNGAWPDDVAAAGLEYLGERPTYTMPNASGIIEELSVLDRAEAIERMTAHTFGIVGDITGTAR